MRACVLVVAALLVATCFAQANPLFAPNQCAGFVKNRPNYVPRPFFTASMESCCWYSANSCCYDPATNKLDTSYLDETAELLEDLATNELTEFCYFALADLACFGCAPYTQSFLLNRGNIPNIVVCQETCDAAYNNCRYSQNVFNGPVTNGTALCQNFFLQLGYQATVASVAAYPNCFYGVTAYSVIADEVGICLNSIYFSSASTFSSSVAVLVAVLAGLLVLLL